MNIKKPVGKKQPVKKESTKKQVVKEDKIEYIPVFPEITSETTKTIDLNWFALSRKFKNKLKFMYSYNSNKSGVSKLNFSLSNCKEVLYCWYISIEINSIKLYLAYTAVWDYYINKQQNFDLNKKIMEIYGYDRR